MGLIKKSRGDDLLILVGHVAVNWVSVAVRVCERVFKLVIVGRQGGMSREVCLAAMLRASITPCTVAIRRNSPLLVTFCVSEFCDEGDMSTNRPHSF